MNPGLVYWGDGPFPYKLVRKGREEKSVWSGVVWRGTGEEGGGGMRAVGEERDEEKGWQARETKGRQINYGARQGKHNPACLPLSYQRLHYITTNSIYKVHVLYGAPFGRLVNTQ